MNRAEQLEAIVNRLVAASDPVEIRAAYADWAATYEDDLDFYGYTAPKIGVALFCRALPDVSAEILDAGCGTGLVGVELNGRGYMVVDGCDFSAEMRTNAKQTGVYRTLAYANFLELLPQYADNSYDGITCIGVYSSSLHPQFLSELIRIIKPNGVLCFTCRPNYFVSDVEIQVKQFAADNVVTIETLTHQPYMTGQDANAAYIVLRKM
ncbi:MAG: class I SAM-dependent DNA methyltransferase [Candidatus Promineifilaceae bacterium]